MALVSSSSPRGHTIISSSTDMYRTTAHHHHLFVKLNSTNSDSTTTTRRKSGQGLTFHVPSSPSEQYGQVSPTFDASFASSMSITTDHSKEGHNIEQQENNVADRQYAAQGHPPLSSPVLMDISPAPASRANTTSIQGKLDAQQPVTAINKHSFPHLARLFKNDLSTKENAASSSSKFGVDRPHLLHHISAPAVVTGSETSLSTLAPPQLRPSHLSKSADNLPRFGQDHDGFFERPMDPPPAPSSRHRGTLPLDWNKASSKSRSASLAAPPLLYSKHQSAPVVPTASQEPESSPYRMDIDGISPGGRLSSPVSRRPVQHPRSVSDSSQRNPFFVSPGREPGSASSSGSGAADGLGEYFTADLSPIPASRKRGLEELPGSPTPAALSTAPLFSKPARRPFEKAMSMTAVPLHGGVVRRQRSSHQLGKRTSSSNLRLSSSSMSSSIVPPVPTLTASAIAIAASSACNKRHAIACAEGKPKTMRRAMSVADAVVPDAIARCKLGGIGADSAANRASIATEPSSYVKLAEGMGPKKERPQMFQHQSMAPVPESSSPNPSFAWHDEITGKALPCFKVKDDGLMRITASTLNDVQAGVYTSQLARFVIIDCRFDYEFQGGHIADAVNLSQTSDVEQALFNVSDLPKPSTSDITPPGEKVVLIFHCEFSAKRAPTTACFLRNQDRLRNNQVYPRIHYPEVYVLQGGYAEFYKQFPERCTGGYMAMDDPNRLAERSIKLNSFRAGQQRQRQFTRANTFTFGQAQHASTMLKIAHDAQDESMSPRPASMMARRPALAPRQPSGDADGFSFPAIKPKAKKSISADGAVPSPGQQQHFSDELEAADSSFTSTNGSGSSPGGPGAGSPCPPTGKQGSVRNMLSRMPKGPSLKLGGGALPARRGMERAQTSAVLMFTR